MKTYRVVADVEELEFFHKNVLPRCKPNEVHFVSMAARNKKLNEKEREKTKLGRSEMFAKQIVRHDEFSMFLRQVRRFETVRDAYLTKAGVQYPDKVLVCYVNICPVDVLSSMGDQISYLQELLMSIANSSVKGSTGGLDDSFYKVRKSFDTCQSIFARNFGTKRYVDIDIDKSDYDENTYPRVKEIIEKNLGPKSAVYVKTGGGLHCLVKKSGLNMDPNKICTEIFNEIEPTEVSINRNEMIPCPGTFQYGEPVVILNKDEVA